VDLPETRPTVLHQSGISALRVCPRKYYNSQVLGLEQREVSDALKDGQALHKALESAAGEPDLDSQRMAAFAQVAADLGVGRIQPLNAARVRAMLVGYFARWGKLQTWAKEYTVEGPIPGVEGMTFTGRIDRVVQVPGGFAVVDYKTASKVDGSYLESLQRQLQGPLYAHYLEQERGMEVVEIVYDLIIKPPSGMVPKMIDVDHDNEVPGSHQMKSGPAKGKWRESRRENMDEFERRLQGLYQDRLDEMILRPSLLITREHRADALNELTLAAREVLWRLDTGNWGENRRACEGTFYPCPFRQLCYSRYSPLVMQNEYRRREETLDTAEEI